MATLRDHHPAPVLALPLARTRRPAAPAAAAMLCALAASVSATASAQTPPPLRCADDREFPCAFDIDAVRLQNGPPVFKFQARVSATKLPRGDAKFATLRVRLLRGQSVVCQESLHDVKVRAGVLNLDVGRGMDCEVDEVLAESDGLTWDLCLGASDDTCLGRLELPSVAYAVQANFAPDARDAVQATRAAQANWAQRAAADAELQLRSSRATGYFDFYGHVALDASWLYPDDAAYAPWAGGEFVQWTPVRAPAARTLVVEGRALATGATLPLRRMTVAADVTHFSGGLTVSPAAGVAPAFTVPRGGLHVVGDSDVTGVLDVDRRVTVASGGLYISSGGIDVRETSRLRASATVLGTLAAADVTTVRAQGLLVGAGGLHVHGTAQLDGPMTIDGTLTARSFDSVPRGELVVQAGGVALGTDLLATRTLSVERELRVGTLAPVRSGGLNGVLLDDGAATVTGDGRVEGVLDVGGALRVGGTATVGRTLDVALATATRGDTDVAGVLWANGGLSLHDGSGGGPYAIAAGRGDGTVYIGESVPAGVLVPLAFRAESTVDVSGPASFAANLHAASVTADGAFAANGGLTVLGATTLTATVDVSGDAGGCSACVRTLARFTGPVGAGGAMSVAGETRVNGRLFIETEAGCPVGYRPDGNGDCRDIDECAEGSVSCGAVRACRNRPGTAVCCYRNGLGTDDCLPPGAKRVFLTSRKYQGGAFGGVDGADDTCTNAYAAASGAALPFVAFLSDDSRDVVGLLPDAGPFVSVNGWKIADDRNDLLDGTLDVGPMQTERGETVAFGGNRFWSGSIFDGTRSDSPNCGNWTSSAGGAIGAVGHPGMPHANYQSPGFGAWARWDFGLNCSDSYHLLCIER